MDCDCVFPSRVHIFVIHKTTLLQVPAPCTPPRHVRALCGRRWQLIKSDLTWLAAEMRQNAEQALADKENLPANDCTRISGTKQTSIPSSWTEAAAYVFMDIASSHEPRA